MQKDNQPICKDKTNLLNTDNQRITSAETSANSVIPAIEKSSPEIAHSYNASDSEDDDGSMIDFADASSTLTPSGGQ